MHTGEELASVLEGEDREELEESVGSLQERWQVSQPCSLPPASSVDIYTKKKGFPDI